tara:strand:+ start:356 stop:562 length:207 start_codon:yes stop_codon:yes gene_type:complete
MSKKPLIRSLNGIMGTYKFSWCRVSPLSSASFLKGIFLHHIFPQYFYNLGYNIATFKSLGRDWNRTKY